MQAALALLVPGPEATVMLATAAAAAFLTGLGGSPHCALMCGPLACAGLGADRRQRRLAALAWHLGRLAAYAVAGALLGGVGHRALMWLRTPVARVLPWLMVAGLLLSALEVGRRLPAMPWLAVVPRTLARLGMGRSANARAALRGAATPFLPCGLLYGAFLIAMGSGSSLAGLAIMVAFALGAIPALVLVQVNLPRLGANPRAERIARHAVPLLAAGLVAWRAIHGTGDGPPSCH
jgi:sulfite exporter TauE/SafE